VPALGGLDRPRLPGRRNKGASGVAGRWRIAPPLPRRPIEQDGSCEGQEPGLRAFRVIELSSDDRQAHDGEVEVVVPSVDGCSTGRLRVVTGRSNTDPLDFDVYQQAAARTGAVIATEHPIVYPTLGLTNEAGEVAGKVKKICRDGQGRITDADRQDLALELGDVLWYLSELCTRLGIRLEEVAAANIAKLSDRASRGVLGGEGDHR
jgi:NTP pyrophosphatase (non-canonical NTP hydrolase)